MDYWILTEGDTVIARSAVQHIIISDMAIDEILLTRLDDENFQLFLPNHVFYLQDEDKPNDPTNAAGAAIPEDSEYWDMMQPPKPEVD